MFLGGGPVTAIRYGTYVERSVTNTQCDFNVDRGFLEIPSQMRTWIATRAFRRLLPLKETLIRHVSDTDTTVSGKSRQAILFTELYICVPTCQLDDSWATDFKTNIATISARLFHPDGLPLISWQKALWELKPRYFRKWGNQLGVPYLALNESSKVLADLAWTYLLPRAEGRRYDLQVQLIGYGTCVLVSARDI